jgi:hypothetical protein
MPQHITRAQLKQILESILAKALIAKSGDRY